MCVCVCVCVCVCLIFDLSFSELICLFRLVSLFFCLFVQLLLLEKRKTTS